MTRYKCFQLLPNLFYATTTIAKAKFHAGFRCGNIHFPLYTKHQLYQSRIRRFSIRLKNRAFRKKHTISFDRRSILLYHYYFSYCDRTKGNNKRGGWGSKSQLGSTWKEISALFYCCIKLRWHFYYGNKITSPTS